MKTYEAITVISNHIIDDGLCDAIILKGSIGRGDDDEFSDVDMYLIVSPEHMDTVLQRRCAYLSAYKEIVYLEDVNFGLPQKVAIYVDALHVDLYVARMEQIGHADPIRVWYDPKGLFSDYIYHRIDIADGEIAPYFQRFCTVSQKQTRRTEEKTMRGQLGSLAMPLRKRQSCSDISMTRNMLSLD